MGNINWNITDNSGKVKSALQRQIELALEKCGIKAEGYAKEKITQNGSVDTGNLRNSITYKVDGKENKCYVGTNVEYGKYIEFGTGIYYVGGRRTPWFYKGKDGNWYRTQGQREKPFLRPAVNDHSQEYKDIIKSELKN